MPKIKDYNFPKHNFEKFQPNPSWTGKGRYMHEDCSIRAVCAATGKTWEEVYDILCVSGKQVFDAPTSDESVERALTNMGYTKHSVKVVKGSKRPTPSSLTRENPDKRLVMRVSGHFVGGRNGKYYDCWDCGTKGIYTYYQKAI